MTGEMPITVAFVVELPGGLVAVTAPVDAELYDEADTKRENKRCIALPSLQEPLGEVKNGIRDLRPWVTAYMKKALIYAAKPEDVKLGSEVVGVTGQPGGDWTKDVSAFVMDSVPPLTVADLLKTV